MKNKPQPVNYQRLLTVSIKEKYFSLLLGMFVSYIITSTLLKLLIPPISLTSPKTPTVGEISSGASTGQVTYTEEKYVVQSGDSLSIIAQKVYGDLYAWPRLLQTNKLLSPDLIEVGMILNITR